MLPILFVFGFTVAHMDVMSTGIPARLEISKKYFSNMIKPQSSGKKSRKSSVLSYKFGAYASLKDIIL